MAEKIVLQLKALRKNKGVTQKELAEAVHVSFQTISKWENGIAMPDITYLPSIARFFEVEMEVLLGMKPLQGKSCSHNFAGKEYWQDKVELMKDWKQFYFNDDYLEFLVTKVWKINRPVDVLDCACGYGYLGQKLLPFLPEGSSYMGLDISEQYLEEGRRMAKDNNMMRFVKGDILTYEITNKYDIVISQLLLSYLPEPQKVLLKMKKALKTDGMLVAIDNDFALAEDSFFIGNQEAFKPKLPDVTKVWNFTEGKGEIHCHLGTELAFLFRKCGLKKIRARMSDCVFVHDGKEREQEKIEKYIHVVQNMERVEEKYAYYLNHGCSWQDAEAFVKYQEDVISYMKEADVFVSRASCLYIVYGFL